MGEKYSSRLIGNFSQNLCRVHCQGAWINIGKHRREAVCSTDATSETQASGGVMTSRLPDGES